MILREGRSKFYKLFTLNDVRLRKLRVYQETKHCRASVLLPGP